MLQRGRKSAAALMAVAEDPERPLAPPELTDPEKAVWRRVVDSMAPGHFPPETHAQLMEYCRASVRASWLSNKFNDPATSDAVRLGLLKQQGKCGQLISTLATKMRIHQISSVRKRVKKTPIQENAP